MQDARLLLGLGFQYQEAALDVGQTLVAGNETRPVHMVNQVHVLDDADLRSRTLEQGDTLGGIVVARRIEHAVEQRLAVISEHRMHLCGHLLRMCVVAAGHLLQIQTKVARHDARRCEIRQKHVGHHAYGAHHPALNFFQRDRALLVCKPLVFVEHRLHQRRGQVMPQVKHAVGSRRVIVAIGAAAAIVQRAASIGGAAHMLEQFTGTDQEGWQLKVHDGFTSMRLDAQHIEHRFGHVVDRAMRHLIQRRPTA